MKVATKSKSDQYTLFRNAFPKYYEWLELREPSPVLPYHGSKGRVLFRFHGNLYDLTNYAPYHPGGPTAVTALSGSEVTLQLMHAHAKDPKVWSILEKHRVKEPNHKTIPQLSAEDSQLLCLRGVYVSQGLFDISLLDQLQSVFTPILLTLLGASLHMCDQHLLGTIIMLFSAHLAVSVGHEAGHFSIMSTGRLNRAVSRWLYIFVSGQDGRPTFSSHNLHHAFSNIVGWDMSLDMGPIIWHETQLDDKKHAISSYNALLFFFAVILAGFYPFISQFSGIFSHWSFLRFYDGPINKYDRRFPGKWACVIIIGRFIISVYVVGCLTTLAVLYVPMLLYMIYGTTHHLSMELMGAEETIQLRQAGREESFLKFQTEHASNWTRLPFTKPGQAPGSLDVHIEHHLFPDMPFKHLGRIQRDVKTLTSKNCIYYREMPVLKLIIEVFQKVCDPFGFVPKDCITRGKGESEHR